MLRQYLPLVPTAILELIHWVGYTCKSFLFYSIWRLNAGQWINRTTVAMMLRKSAHCNRSVLSCLQVTEQHGELFYVLSSDAVFDIFVDTFRLRGYEGSQTCCGIVGCSGISTETVSRFVCKETLVMLTTAIYKEQCYHDLFVHWNGKVILHYLACWWRYYLHAYIYKKYGFHGKIVG